MVIVYDASLKELIRIAPFTADDGIHAAFVVWSPDGTKIAVRGEGTAFNGYRIWDVTTGEKLGELNIETWSRQIWWLPDNAHIAMQQGDNTEVFVYSLDGIQVDTWDFSIETPDVRTKDANDTVVWTKDILDMAWTPDGQFLVTSTIYDFPIDIWDAESRENIASLYCGSCLYDLRVVLSPKGQMVLFGAVGNGYLEVQRINPVQFVDSFTIPDDFYPNDYNNIAFGWRDDSHIWNAASDGFLYVWRFKVKSPTSTFPIDIDHLQDITSDGTKALYGEGHELRVADIESGEVMASTTIKGDAVFVDRPWEPDPRG
jgi:WD40 repeat protein